MSDQTPIVPLTPEPERDYYFTFGANHLNGRGRNRYVVVRGTFHSARQKMVDQFGTAWAYQYFRAETVPTPDGEPAYLYRGAGVQKYGLIQIDFQTGQDIPA